MLPSRIYSGDVRVLHLKILNASLNNPNRILHSPASSYIQVAADEFSSQYPVA